jgi:hypothetical protein
MSRMAKTTLLTLLVTTVAATGCKPNKGTASPEDYFGLIQIAFQGGEIAAMIGRNEAIKAKSFAGCVSSETLIAAFDSAGDALNAKVLDNVVIPGFDLDLSECMAFREVAAEPETPATEETVAPEGGENASLSSPVVVAVVMAPAEGEEPAAAEPAAEEAPAAEPATEEAPVEEAPAEEPVAEEPAAEEAPVEAVMASNEDVAAMVESIAGVAIIAGNHYATKLKAVDCKKGELAIAALGYLSGMVKPIADEIADPDGKISIPAVTLDLSACSEG